MITRNTPTTISAPTSQEEELEEGIIGPPTEDTRPKFPPFDACRISARSHQHGGHRAREYDEPPPLPPLPPLRNGDTPVVATTGERPDGSSSSSSSSKTTTNMHQAAAPSVPNGGTDAGLRNHEDGLESAEAGASGGGNTNNLSISTATGQAPVGKSKSVTSSYHADTAKAVPGAAETPATQASSTFSFSPQSQQQPRQAPRRGNTTANRGLFSCCSCLGPYRLPILIVVIVYILLTTGAATYLFNKVMTIPGLQTQVGRLKSEITVLEGQVSRLEEQVDELEIEVDRLGTEVDRLAVENDRFAAENDRLSLNNDDYEALNVRMEASAAQFEARIAGLNASNVEYEVLNDGLRIENERYRESNAVLNVTVGTLGDEVDELGVVRDNLTAAVERYGTLNDELAMEIDELSLQNSRLNQTVQGLDGVVSDLQSANDEYRELNANLSSVVSFLNDASGQLGRSFDALVAHLADSIDANRHLLTERVHLGMDARVSGWRCGLSDAFVGDWIDVDTRLPIGEDDYDDVIEYVDETVLSELCADLADFEMFLSVRFNDLAQPSDLTVRDLAWAVNRYTAVLLNHYFPDEGEEGITELGWDDADFKCANLPREERFRWFP